MNEIKLSTERLKLRLIELSDLDSIHTLHSLPETDKFNTLGIPENIEETKLILKDWISENRKSECTNFTFAIEQKVSRNLLDLLP